MTAGPRIDIYGSIFQYRWRLWSGSRIIAASTESYTRRSRSISNLETVTGGVFEKISSPEFPAPYGLLHRHILNAEGYDWQAIPVRLVES